MTSKFKKITSAISFLFLSSCLTESTYALIPFEEGQGIYEATKKDQKENSPIFGMIAAESNLLGNVRFFGKFGSLSQAVEAGIPKEWMEQRLKFLILPDSFEKSDIPLDHISMLIQHLFRSQDLSVFNVTDLTGEPLSVLVKRKKTIDLQKMNKVLECIITAKKQLDFEFAKKKIVRILLDSNSVSFLAPNCEQMSDLLQKLKNLEVSKNEILSEEQKMEISRLKGVFQANVFAHTLVEALKEELSLKVSPYPKNICVLSLLTYVWKMANHKEDLKALTYLIDPNKINSHQKFSPHDYIKNKHAFLKKMKRPLSKNSPTTEEIALFRAGFSNYEESIHHIICQKYHVKYSRYQRDYPDCVETSIRNFFYIIFTRSGLFRQDIWYDFTKKLNLFSDDEINLQNYNQYLTDSSEEDEDFNNFISEPEKWQSHLTLPKNPTLSKIFLYLQKYPSPSLAGTDEAHNDWSEICSGLLGTNTCSVDYKNDSICNIRSNIYNLLNVLGLLTADTELQSQWTDKKIEEIPGKLDRLCTLFSREDRTLDWSINDEQVIADDSNLNIDFYFDDSIQFTWDVTNGHSEIKKAPSSGWIDEISWDNPHLKHPLLQQWFLQEKDLILNQKIDYSHIYGLNLNNTKTMIHAVDFLLYRDAHFYYPLLYKWLNKYTADPESLTLLKSMFFGHWSKIKAYFPQEFLEKTKIDNSVVQSFLKEIMTESTRDGEGLDNIYLQTMSKEQYLSSWFKVLGKTGSNYKVIKSKFLHLEARNGNEITSKFLLEEGANSNDSYRWFTPLIAAIMNERNNLVQLLLTYKADPNLSNPLYFAVRNSNAEIVEFLLEKKGDMNRTDRYEDSLLHQAIYANKPEIAKVLIKYNADLNIKNNKGYTPLLYTLTQFSELPIQLCLLLITHGADVAVTDEYGATPLHHVVESNSLELMELLINKNIDVNAMIKVNGRTPLHLAASEGSIKTVRFLIENKANVNALDKNEWTPLVESLVGNTLEVVKLLVDNKAIVNTKNYSKNPLNIAVHRGYFDMATYLIQQGAEINVPNLMLDALKGKNIEIIKFLIGANVAIDEEDSHGRTPLHLAVTNGNCEIVNLLIKKGALINKKNKEGQTPFHLAVGGYNLNAFKWIKGDLNIIKELIEARANINEMDNDGETPIQYAVRRGKPKIIEYLIDEGVDLTAPNLLHDAGKVPLETLTRLVKKGALVNGKDANGNTPLHQAVFTGKTDFIKFLIKNGSNINKKGHNGRTPLHLAAYHSKDLNVVKLLIQNKADPTIKDKGNKTPREATPSYEKDIIEFLIQCEN